MQAPGQELCRRRPAQCDRRLLAAQPARQQILRLVLERFPQCPWRTHAADASVLFGIYARAALRAVAP
eukprot:4487315-Lingulodinium_polyedra.AAC.1